jgi:FkbM family methyltransferase
MISKRRTAIIVEKTYKISSGLVFSAARNINFEGLFNDIFRHRSYFHNEFLSIPPRSTVIDIGANVGVFSVFAALECPTARVLSFEPSSENFKHLKRNIRQNRLLRITPYHLAVGGRSGVRTLHLHNSDAMHTLLPDYLKDVAHLQSQIGSRKEKVKVISLAEIFKKHKIEKCDFLKVDCEGGEYEIFEKAPKSVFSKIHRLSLEYHNSGNLKGERLRDLFLRRGFRVWMSPPFENGCFGRIVAVAPGVPVGDRPLMF